MRKKYRKFNGKRKMYRGTWSNPLRSFHGKLVTNVPITENGKLAYRVYA